MASRKPDPTPEQIMKTLNLSGGRIVPAVEEVLRILQTSLPPLINYVNENRKGSSGRIGELVNLNLSTPKAYQIAGEVLSDSWPVIVVACEIDTETISPRQLADHINMMVFVAYDKFSTKREWADCNDIAGLVRGVMHWYVTGQADEEGRTLWQQLSPTGITSIPGRWTDYQGMAVHFQMWQPPMNDLWTG